MSENVVLPNGQNDGGKNNFYAITDTTNLIALFMDLGLTKEEVEEFMIALGYIRKTTYITKPFPKWVTDVDTLNEWLGDSFYFGNYLKTFWINKGLRHNGTSKSRELKKRKHYFGRLGEKVKRSGGDQ